MSAGRGEAGGRRGGLRGSERGGCPGGEEAVLGGVSRAGGCGAREGGRLPGWRGEEDGDGAQRRGGEERGAAGARSPFGWGGVAAGAAREPLCAGGVRLPELGREGGGGVRARWLRGQRPRGLRARREVLRRGRSVGFSGELLVSLPTPVRRERPAPSQGK